MSTPAQTPPNQSRVLPDGTVECALKPGQTRRERLAPSELWRGLMKRTEGGSFLLGRDVSPADGARIIYYRFGNDRDEDLREDPVAGKSPIQDLSQDTNFQQEVRKAMNELERIGHVRFVKTSPRQQANLVIGYADRWNQTSTAHKRDHLGHASYPNVDGFSIMSLVRKPNRTLLATIRHELGHALGLNHPRNYEAGTHSVQCDIGIRHDVQNRSVMSYLKSINHFGEDDVKAIQLLYGPSRVSDPYRVPTVVQRVDVMAADDKVLPVAVRRTVIDYRNAQRIHLAMNRMQASLPNLQPTITEIESTPQDDRITLLDPPSRIRFRYQGGQDVLRVQAPERGIGISGIAQEPVKVRIETLLGNNIVQALDSAASTDGGDITVQLIDIRKRSITSIESTETSVISGVTGHQTKARRFTVKADGKTTWIAVPLATQVKLEDQTGEPIALPTTPTVLPPIEVNR